MTGRRILLLGLGRTGHPYVHHARARGLAVSVADRPSLLRALRPPPGPADRLHPVPAAAEEAYYAAGSRAVAADPVHAVLPVSELQVLPAALLADELGLPGCGVPAALVCRNKLLQRQVFERHGIPQPDFHLAHGAGDALRWARDRYPVVLKPLSGTGSVGVRVIADRAGLASWAAGRTGPFLVEEFCAGAEYSVEGVVRRGDLAFSTVTAKTVTPPPYRVELAHRVPAALPPGAGPALGELARRVVAATRVDTALVHLEVKVGPAGAAVIELAARGAGDHILDATRAALGVDLYDAGVALAAGDEPVLTPAADGAAVVWFPTAPPGRVTDVRGLEDVRRLPGVLAAHLEVSVGDPVPALRSSTDRIGSVLVRGRSAAAAEATLAAARRLLAVRTEGAV